MALPYFPACDGNNERQIPIVAPPTISTTMSDIILFLHPFYTSPSNELFALQRVDRASDDGLVYGIHHRTALTACQIVANNAFDGYLSLDTEGSTRVDGTVGLDDILTEKKYYFIVPGRRDYPIVPSFRDWQFPHGCIPDVWSRLPHGRSNDACLITKHSWAVKKGYLIPLSHNDWFDTNYMLTYDRTVSIGIRSAENFLPLKSDVRYCFDHFKFAIVPKPHVQGIDSTTAAEHGANQKKDALLYTVHTFDDSPFSSFHHNIQLPHLSGASREYLFARFASTTFMLLKPFLSFRIQRYVARYRHKNDGNGEIICEKVDGETLRKLYGHISKDDCEYVGSDDDTVSSSGSVDGFERTRESSTDRWYGKMMEEQEEMERGRSRKRVRRRSFDE